MEYIEFNNNSDHKYAEKRQYNCLLLQMHDKKKYMQVRNTVPDLNSQHFNCWYNSNHY